MERTGADSIGRGLFIVDDVTSANIVIIFGVIFHEQYELTNTLQVSSSDLGHSFVGI